MKPELNKSTQSFLNRYRIIIRDTSQRIARVENRLLDFYEKHDFRSTIAFQSEPLFTLEISESDLQRLVEIVEDQYNQLVRNGEISFYEYHKSKIKKEEALRDKNPALKKAYEQYRLLLKLTGEFDD